jgi:hypothetical protein
MRFELRNVLIFSLVCLVNWPVSNAADDADLSSNKTPLTAAVNTDLGKSMQPVEAAPAPKEASSLAAILKLFSQERKNIRNELALLFANAGGSKSKRDVTQVIKIKTKKPKRVRKCRVVRRCRKHSKKGIKKCARERVRICKSTLIPHTL